MLFQPSWTPIQGDGYTPLATVSPKGYKRGFWIKSYLCCLQLCALEHYFIFLSLNFLIGDVGRAIGPISIGPLRGLSMSSAEMFTLRDGQRCPLASKPKSAGSTRGQWAPLATSPASREGPRQHHSSFVVLGSFVGKPAGQRQGVGVGSGGRRTCWAQTPGPSEPEKSQIWGQTNGH